jgi:SAM-dependent methyltransferase
MYDKDYAAAWLRFEQEGKDIPRLNHIYPYLREVFASQPGVLRVLDVGCGWGMALDVCDKPYYVGVDPTWKFLVHIRQTHHYRALTLLQGSLPDNIPVPDASADLVLCSMTLHCVPDLEASVRTLFAKSRGKVVITEFADAAEPLLRSHFARIDEDRGGHLSGLYTLADGIQVMGEAYLRREQMLADLLAQQGCCKKTRLGDLFVGYECCTTDSN